jgi:molybdenum cofactor guanylyltransferase
VLTGGASRRMGRTKALVPVDGTAMAARVAASLRGVGCSPVVAVGGDRDELVPLGLQVVPDDHPGQGPLGGIVTAMRMAATLDGADLLVVACDLPFVGPAELAALVAGATAHPDADVVVARTDRREPACALWRPSSHTVTTAAFDAGERAVHAVLDRLVVAEVELPASALRNINVPADVPGYP